MSRLMADPEDRLVEVAMFRTILLDRKDWFVYNANYLHYGIIRLARQKNKYRIGGIFSQYRVKKTDRELQGWENDNLLAVEPGELFAE